MNTVLLCVDGSDLDRTLATTAHRLFGPDASYVVVNVAEDIASYAAFPVAIGAATTVTAPALGRFVDGLDGSADDARDVAQQVVDEAGLGEAVTVGEVGNPVSVILEAARRFEVDVIVVGNHERSWFARLFDPSVSESIQDLSERPVLVVHDPR